ncbi:MAG: hydrolase [Candidatus Hydrogenedentota bacterium]|nr:MAG: hydrolase [Candidatus Hydrogenedentota bacterium]
MEWEVTNGILVTPDQIIAPGAIRIQDDKIAQIGKKITGELHGPQIDLNGLMVFPGIINCHDHLLGTYLPRVGDRRPYLNWLMWDNDLKASPVYAERQQIESADLYQMGGYRHLIAGVTSVQDHIPHFVQDMFKDQVPIRVIDKYAVAHSATSFALKWGGSIEEEHSLAVEKDIPFITHCSEGYDKETVESVNYLNERGAIDNHTVLIHGIAFSDDDIALLKERKSHVVWCPVSNLYMFEDTAPIGKLLQAGVNVTLGTDSPMSGSVNIFEEMQVAKSYYLDTYGEVLPDKVILQMLTTNAAKAMFLPDRGKLAAGNLADFIVIHGDSSDPYSAFTSMDYGNIMLVVIGGKPRYGDELFIPLFEAMQIPVQKIKVAGHKKVVDGDILGLLDRVRKAVGFHKELAFLPVEPWD